MSEIFAPIPSAELDAEARALYDEILSTRAAVVDIIGLRGPNETLRGPFDPLLRTPKIGNAFQRLGLLVRSASSLSPAACAVCVLTVVDALRCDFEWQAHSGLAASNGVLQDSDIQAIAAGRAPSGQLGIVWEFSLQQVKDCDVSQATVDAALAVFGERGVAELTVLVGYYQIISMLTRTCAPR